MEISMNDEDNSTIINCAVVPVR